MKYRRARWLLAPVGVAMLVTAVATPGSAAPASKLTTHAPNTVAEAKAEAASVAQRGQVKMTPAEKSQASAESKSMAGMQMSTSVTAVQGPTNLATNVGGSWNNYAFTIPNEPSCSGGVGTLGSSEGGGSVKACPDGANGPSAAVHAVQLYNGKVLVMAGSGNQWQNLQAGDFSSWVWDPTQTDQSKAWKYVATPWDMFCAGHVELSNGNILVTGGTTAYPQYDSKGNLVHDWDGSKQSYIFDVASETYVQTGTMLNARWYPSVISVGGGKVLVTGGLDDQAKSLGVVTHNTDTSELYDPATGKWTALPTLDFSLSDPSKVVAKGGTNSTRTLPFYPGLVLLKGGTLFYSGESNGDNGVLPGLWNYKTGAYTTVAAPPTPYQRNAGATVLLPPAQAQKVMIFGGGDYSLPTVSSTEIMDLSNISSPSSLKWTAGPSMSAAKMYVGAVILPDGNVFETNGAANFRVNGVHTAEEYSPTANKFTVMNSPTLDRLYHSNAFLEPNGQVAIMGSQPLDASFEMHISIWSPPYLYKGTRPTVSSTFKQFAYTNTAQGPFTVTLPSGTTLGQAWLLRPSATTHSTDPDQRAISLGVTKNANGTYSFTPPTDDTVAPEGQYMLYVTASNGVPSVAEWVSIGVPFAGSSGGTTPPPAVTVTANAGPDQSVATGAKVTLSGSGTASDGSATTLKWSQTAGTTVALSSTTAAAPTFTAPTTAGSETFSLVATSGSVSSAADTVTVTQAAGGGGTSSGLTLSEVSMSGWVAKLSAQSSVAKSGQDVTLQVLTNGTWTYATNDLSDSTGKVTFTWGGGSTLQLRATIPATGVTSNTISVSYGP